MIVVKIIGGLGNQLFQYALGRHLAIKNQTDLFLDLRAFDHYYSLHKYALGHFNIKAPVVSKKELQEFSAIKNPYRRFLRKLSNLQSPWRFLKENNDGFSINILNSSGNIYLDGYWQSENYFAGIRPIILEEFKIQSDISDKTKEVKRQMESQNCASIHIRRGDYISNKKTNAVHGTCDLQYYRSAMSKLESLTDIDCYFLFSDDIAWVKENLHSSVKAIYVDHTDASTNYEDLFLMSNCKHHIIANSSFSWWGAWLNDYVNKIVIAPTVWYVDSSKKSAHIIPKGWIKC
ncbi:MAG: alpha-1,2-fucosyltransferase [Reichenbachiella sp.]|uniref:alpha-1,2-fucosyltransferase n=1 Tax=Reichenbachiella sp. TaxID=2184521 RepID=UPI00326434D2